MLSMNSGLSCCDAYVRATSGMFSMRTSNATSRWNPAACYRPRVLIIESRDDVSAQLKPVLEDAGVEVERVDVSARVSAEVEVFAPDLILVNEDMPDESGWLVICKIRQSRYRQLVWMYAVRRPDRQADWKDVYGVDQVIEYGGVLVQLAQQIRQRIGKWLNLPNGEARGTKFIGPLASPVSPGTETIQHAAG